MTEKKSAIGKRTTVEWRRIIFMICFYGVPLQDAAITYVTPTAQCACFYHRSPIRAPRLCTRMENSEKNRALLQFKFII